jgi:lactose/L-arabinose transport system permease protein
MNSLSQRRLGRSLLLHLFLTPLAVIWLFPLWMMIVFSTMPDNGIFSPGIELLPHDNFLANFQNLQRDTDFVGAIGI